MAEEPKATTAAQHLAGQDWRTIAANLGKALEKLGADMSVLAKHQKEAREVAALFELHRQWRFRPEGAPPRAESMAMMMQAMDGYEPQFQEQLAMFGRFLTHEAGGRYGTIPAR